jgi:hypothetical protein
VTEILKQTAWPITVLIVALLFRKKINEGIGRIVTAKLPGGTELLFGRLLSDKSPAEEVQTRPRELPPELVAKAHWERTGNLYWLGRDIMWTIDIVMREAPTKYIVHGLRQSVHHLTELGLLETRAGQRLRGLVERANSALESDWTPERRAEFASELQKVGGELGRIAEANESDFRSKPG